MALNLIEPATAEVVFYKAAGRVRWNDAAHRMLGRAASVDVLFDDGTRELHIRGACRGGCSFPVLLIDDDMHYGLQAKEIYDVTGTPTEAVHMTPAYVGVPEGTDPETDDMSSYVGEVTLTLPAFV